MWIGRNFGNVLDSALERRVVGVDEMQDFSGHRQSVCGCIESSFNFRAIDRRRSRCWSNDTGTEILGEPVHAVDRALQE